MDIYFYLNDTEVRKVLFKQFSSRSHIWYKLIEEYMPALEKEAGSLHLKYIPASNEVEASFDSNSTILQILSEEVAKTSSLPLRYTEVHAELSH
jgi:hypothetical protein